MSEGEPLYGLTSAEALQRLHDELLAEIRLYEGKTKFWSVHERVQHHFLHPARVDSVLHASTCMIILAAVISLVIAYVAQPHKEGWLMAEAFFLLCILFFNLYFLSWDDKLKRKEHVTKAKRVLKQIRDCIRDSPGSIWHSSNYMTVHAPLSPCVSVQWTVRDGELVNLPAALLVAGDVVYLRPGHNVCCKCKIFQPEEVIVDEREYLPGEIFIPATRDESTADTHAPKLRTPLKPQPCIVLETPFLQNLRLFLEESHSRPATYLNNERYYIYSVCVERRLVPAVLLFLLVVNVLRYLLIGSDVGHWTELIITMQVQAIIPLLALVSPMIWRLLDCLGMARVIAMFNLCLTLPPESRNEFESEEVLNKDVLEAAPMTDVLRHFRDIIRGTSDTLPRTCNLLHVLGNVTSFCCVDKKGVLSWPNPTAEKVFFLRGGSHQGSSGDMMAEQREDTEEEGDSGTEEGKMEQDIHCTGFNYEVLDLTQDPKSGYKLSFDDQGWKKHITSLKPLGLNILLDTCNIDTVDNYTEFADHVTSASFHREGSVPVVNRRCFCELSRHIGFTDEALDIFELEQVLGLYKHMPPTEAPNKTLTRLKSFTKYKMPMPNMFSVVAKETTSGCLQLFSQGTGDLVLSMCSDYWNGEQLCTLQSAERKKICDFYQRSSMSSYCTAFSYRPLSHSSIGEEYGHSYMEVPEHYTDARVMDHSPLSPSPLRNLLNMPPGCELRGYHGSADSLITGCSGTTGVHDVNDCFDLQSHQVFIGMITMQYQAKQDIVQLIEELENACIRFVHFSKENELRSRVFSEKMGLEAGWNCHISLLSDEASDAVPSHPVPHRTVSLIPQSTQAGDWKATKHTKKNRRRLSAPACISVDMTQVKFESTCTVSEHPINVLHPKKDTQMSPDGNNQANRSLEVVHSPSQSFTSPIAREGESHPMFDVKTPLLHQHDLCMSQTSTPRAERSRSREEVSLMPGGNSSSEEDRDEEDRVSVESYPPSSYVTENTDSVTGGLGLSNRAKLPKGIENIRPHLATVDNVPLLVSLFTDCTPTTTQEMLSILQENGEVVCVLGSSASMDNTGIFLQSNASLAVEPLYPQICVRESVIHKPWADNDPTPMELAAMLNSLPCALSFTRTDKISILQLIAVARHHCICVRTMFLLYLMLQGSLVLVVALSSVFLLVPPLAVHHLLWLSLVVVPLLSLSLMANPIQPSVLNMAQGKNRTAVPPQCIVEFTSLYLVRFAPTVLVCLLCHCLSLYHFCELSQESLNNTNSTAFSNATDISTSSCHVIFGDRSAGNGTWNGLYSSNNAALTISQNVLAFQLVLFFILHTMCFVQRLEHIWKGLPFCNKFWCAISAILLVFQVVYFISSVHELGEHVHHLPLSVWLITAVWPVCLLAIMELVKRREIKVSVRYQKRARLDFGTKLGMNSPF